MNDILISKEDAINVCKGLDGSASGLVRRYDVIAALLGLGERGSEKRGKWCFDGENEFLSTFRICSNCGAVYKLNSGDDAFMCCPNCFIRMVNE